MHHQVILAIDEGTTNAKVVLVSQAGEVHATGSHAVEIRYPRPGWVEQDANQIWSATSAAMMSALGRAPHVEVVAIGVSNQRESVLAWNRFTGEPLGPVITWQCRRTTSACNEIKNAGLENLVIGNTGLPIDPLFPATKVRWLLENCCQGLAKGDICIGTVDSWLIWKLTTGSVHATDASNAARTQLYNIRTGRWDEELCDLFGVYADLLPVVRDSSFRFGLTRKVAGLPDDIPVASAIGDSHAALFAHGAFSKGESKVTLGTGSSVMTTIGEFATPARGITTTIAWQIGGRSTYAYEGNILVSASILPWTAQLLGLESVDALLECAQSVDNAHGVNLVPAHAGLGSPYWNPEARGMIDGLTFGTTPAHVAHAATLSILLQICDVLDVVKSSGLPNLGDLSVDGGPSRNSWLMQTLADCLDHPVTIRDNAEASAIGAAYLAGLESGFWNDLDAITGLVQPGKTFRPTSDSEARSSAHAGWRTSIARSMHGT